MSIDIAAVYVVKVSVFRVTSQW